MNQQEECTFSSVMIYSKQEVLDFIIKNQIYFPTHLQSKLLLWNCFPIVNYNTEQIEMSFGSFFYQIIQLSQIQVVRTKFKDYLNYNLSNLQPSALIALCRFIFQKESLNTFPQSKEFSAVNEVLQESFVYENHNQNQIFSYYKSLNGTQVQDINEQDIKYRILLYKSNENDGSKPYLLFSTNNNIQYLIQQKLIPNCINQKNLYTSQQNFKIFEQSKIKQQNFQFQNNQNQQQTQLFSFPKQTKIVPNSNQMQIQNIFQQPQKLDSPQVNNNFNYNQNNNASAFIKNNWQDVKYFANNIPNNISQNQNNGIKQNNNNFFNQNNNTQQFVNNTQQSQFGQQKQEKQQSQQAWPQQQTQNYMQIQKCLSNDYQLQCYDRSQFKKQDLMPFAYNKDLKTNANSDQNPNDLFSTQHINDLHGTKPEMNHNRIITYYKKETQQDNQQCKICTEIYNSNQSILTPCCHQKLHAECVQENLYTKAKENMNFTNIQCYSCARSLENFQDFIKNNITKQLFGEIVKKQVLANIPLKCFNCQLPIEASKQILSKQVQIECQKCKKNLCSLCRQEYHGQNQQNQQCPSLSKEIQKAIKGMPVLVCPFCNLLQTKDEKCNHVRCFNCGKELCAACSADRIPILRHGNHYHRKGCTDYKPWEQKGNIITKEEFDKKNCEICKTSQKPCAYPISLEEYKKLKQF